MTAVFVTDPDPAEGCTGCGSQATVELHPHHGRRCPDCVTLPAGRFRDDLAADMVAFGRVDAAWVYLAAWLCREADERFARAVTGWPQ